MRPTRIAAVASLLLLGAGCLPSIPSVPARPFPSPKPVNGAVNAPGSVTVPVNAPAPPSGMTGAYGVATVGPTCPVQRIPPDAACGDRPLKTRIAFIQKGVTIATVTTDADGSFTISLPAGIYDLGRPDGAPLYPRIEGQSVTVTQGQMTRVDVKFDSGIR